MIEAYDYITVNVLIYKSTILREKSNKKWKRKEKREWGVIYWMFFHE